MLIVSVLAWRPRERSEKSILMMQADRPMFVLSAECIQGNFTTIGASRPRYAGKGRDEAVGYPTTWRRLNTLVGSVDVISALTFGEFCPIPLSSLACRSCAFAEPSSWHGLRICIQRLADGVHPLVEAVAVDNFRMLWRNSRETTPPLRQPTSATVCVGGAGMHIRVRQSF